MTPSLTSIRGLARPERMPVSSLADMLHLLTACNLAEKAGDVLARSGKLDWREGRQLRSAPAESP